MVIPGYTHGVKTAVSIPDPLFEAADRLARRRKVSRSALYAEALERLLAEQADDDVTARLDDVYTEHVSGFDEAVAAAQAETLREEW
jgi:metal-responsive CopG/Arc/MetJ family transcriptional regulator